MSKALMPKSVVDAFLGKDDCFVPANNVRDLAFRVKDRAKFCGKIEHLVPFLDAAIGNNLLEVVKDVRGRIVGYRTLNDEKRPAAATGPVQIVKVVRKTERSRRHGLRPVAAIL